MKPRYVDIHAHVNFTAFDADRKETIQRAFDAGVGMINVGTDKETSRSAVELAEQYESGVYAIIGLHPVDTNEAFDADLYRRLAKNKKVVGIGECGLDYFHVSDPVEQKKQKDTFTAQIELALELDLPLMLHVRNAYKDTLDILRSYKKEAGDKLRGDIHFFAGSVEEGKEFLDLGFYLSFTGVVTFAKQYVELVQNCPLDRIMIETDCPYVAPAPHRGKRNEPAYVIEMAKAIAKIKGIDEKKIAEQLLENTRKCFNLQGV